MYKLKKHPKQTVCILCEVYPQLQVQVKARSTYYKSLLQCSNSLSDQKLKEPPPQEHTTQQHLSSNVKVSIFKAITAKESIPEGYGQRNTGRLIIP